MWYSQCREIVKIPVISPIEAICPSWELADEELKMSYKPDDWCANFHEHPVTIDAGPENAHRVCGYALWE